MKKLLALVLALVMVMSLCVTSNAAFAGEEYDYDEAVEVMAAVGVFKGDENGKFNGKSELTREQAAKLIAYLDLGEKTAEALPGVKVFNDVEANRWSAKYVAYCADAGYLAGVGNGNFDPTGKLTGYAFGKMLLCALGYDAAVEAFTGANWSIAVAKLMQSNDIAKGVDGSASATLTREQAAQYCLNALKADMVFYKDKGTQISINGAVIATGATGAEPLTNTTDDDYREASKDTVQQLVEKLYPKMVLDNDTDVVDGYGRPAVTWYDEDNDEIGTYADAADYVLVAQKNTTMTKLIEDNDLKKKVTSGFTGSEDVACGTVVELWVDNKAVTEKVTYNYVLVEVTDVDKIDDEDELYEDYGATVTYTLDCDAIDGTVVDVLSESKDGYQAIGSFEEDDILAAVVNEDGEILEIAVADTFNGKVSAKGTNYVKVDGTKYAAVSAVFDSELNFDDTFTFYQDPNGVVLSKKVYEEAEDTLNYVYVFGFSKKVADGNLYNTENSAKVKVVYTDGTVETVDYNVYKAASGTNKGKYVAKLNGTETLLKDLTVANGWYAYTENDDGAVTLKSAEKADVSAKLAVTAKKDVKTVASGVYATSTTKVSVFNDDGLVKTYTGYAKFPNELNKVVADADHALVVYGSSTKYAKAVYVYDGEADEDVETIDVALFVSAGDENEDGTVCTFYVDGAKVEYTVDTTDLTSAGILDDATAGNLFKVTLSDDVATLAYLASTDYVTGEIKVVSDEYVVIASTELPLDDDCAVYQVSKDGKTVSAGTLAEKKDAVAIKNSDGDATQIFIYKDIDKF